MPADSMIIQKVDGDTAAAHVDELRALYAEVYADPPYEWGADSTVLFAERFETQRQLEGFVLVEARDGNELAGIAFGFTLPPTTGWWQGLLIPVPAEVIAEQPGRTFALIELLVRVPWRRQGVARTMHDLLLTDRPEERATLTALPATAPAQAAYRKWGWQTVSQKRNPLPGSPLFDVLVKELKSA
ncbi:MAG TPA: GNAT family N-acetyltransferase [Streptosporangiaceae bacterium]|nr:GNAT family N-acetyltransferase [Streptosporangiaceae bacterium]